MYRRDYNSFNFVGDQRNRSYGQTSTGGAVRLGFPVTEFITFGTRYSLVFDNITLDKNTFFIDPDGSGPKGLECDPNRAGRYLCDEIGNRITSSLGYTVAFDNTNGIRATRGQRLVFNQDFAGLGGDTRYLRTRFDATKYFRLPRAFILSAHAEGGYIHALQSSPGPGRDAIRLNDRFFGPQMRGFDIRGIGPRIQSIPYTCPDAACTNPQLDLTQTRITDALGGRAYYMGRLELEVPVSASIKNMGLRPSAFVDVGSLFKLTPPELLNIPTIGTPKTGVGPSCVQNLGDSDTSNDAPCDPALFNILPGRREFYVGDSPKPRLSIGVGVNWISPFGPLRIDIAKALLKQDGDDTKLFSFNVGTQF